VGISTVIQLRDIASIVIINHIRNKDIICLLETHCPFQVSLILPNFSAVHLSRSKNKKTNTISGGISVFVKSELKPGIKLLQHSNNDYIWIKLCKSFLGIQEDIYLCYLYNPPENSSYTQSLETDIFEIIENDIVNYSEKGKILIMGDLNARRGKESDFIENEEHDSNIPRFDDYTPDFNIIYRLSQDSTVLPRGRLLNDICIQTGLRILNGRCTGDLTGKCTCHNYRGSSVVDYCSRHVSESLEYLK
jgi:hypothetical protein